MTAVPALTALTTLATLATLVIAFGSALAAVGHDTDSNAARKLKPKNGFRRCERLGK